MRAIPVLPVLPVLAAAALAACAPEPEVSYTTAPVNALVLGEPYRFQADECRRTQESAVTSIYLDHTAELVACPTGSPDAVSLVQNNDAESVGDWSTWTLYSVPIA